MGELKNTFQLDWGAHAIFKLLSAFQFESVLDIGAGAGEHKRLFQYFNKKTYSVDLVKSADYQSDFTNTHFDRKFDAIWCSHVLEHQRNVGLFLDKIYDVLDDDGVLAVVVPIHGRETLISGHLTSWSIPLLCYNLILAGFDCSHASILSTYELALIVKKIPARHSELDSVSAHGADADHNFENLKPFFPFQAFQGANVLVEGIVEHNWGSVTDYKLPTSMNDKTDIIIQSKNLEASPLLTPRFIR